MSERAGRVEPGFACTCPCGRVQSCVPRRSKPRFLILNLSKSETDGEGAGMSTSESNPKVILTGKNLLIVTGEESAGRTDLSPCWHSGHVHQTLLRSWSKVGVGSGHRAIGLKRWAFPVGPKAKRQKSQKRNGEKRRKTQKEEKEIRKKAKNDKT